jgi:hypothetical protein
VRDLLVTSPTFQPVPPPKSLPKPHDTPIQHLDAVVARLGLPSGPVELLGEKREGLAGNVRPPIRPLGPGSILDIQLSLSLDMVPLPHSLGSGCSSSTVPII